MNSDAFNFFCFPPFYAILKLYAFDSFGPLNLKQHILSDSILIVK